MGHAGGRSGSLRQRPRTSERGRFAAHHRVSCDHRITPSPRAGSGGAARGDMNVVKTVIGTGDPFDSIGLIPLIADWRVPRNCLVALRGEKCEAAITRLYVLEAPIEGHGVLGICETHHTEFSLA